MFNTTNPDGVALDGLTFTDELGTWRKSQRSGPDGNCVEVTKLSSGVIGVRNTKDRAAGMVEFTQAEVRAFFAGVKDGEFDYLA